MCTEKNTFACMWIILANLKNMDTIKTVFPTFANSSPVFTAVKISSPRL